MGWVAAREGVASGRTYMSEDDWRAWSSFTGVWQRRRWTAWCGSCRQDASKRRQVGCNGGGGLFCSSGPGCWEIFNLA